MAGWMDIESIVPYHRPLVVASLGPYGTRHMKPSRLLPLLFLLALTSVGLAVSVGSSTLRLDTVWTALLTGQDSVAREVILDLRLPRALNAFTVGGLLALSGVLMQVLLRNSLADPYVLGISGCAAVVSLMLALGDETRLRGMLFWLMGDLSFAPFSPAALCVLLAVGGLAIAGARSLNVLARGEIESQSLGVALSPARIALFCATAALTATAVTTAGGVGFIGLVTPHLVRLVAGSNHRIVVPASILLGGTLLTLADTLARIAASPRQLPVGALTALIGVPLFLILMRRERRITS